MQTTFPCALTIAGSDSGGGAGIQGDLKTFMALGVYGASVITAVTAQNTRGVQAVYALPPSIIAAQLSAVLDDLPIRAVKIGMLASAPAVAVIAEQLQRRLLANVVLDPVLTATSGESLVGENVFASLRASLIPLATLLTPNLPEAAALLGWPHIEEPLAAARALLELGARGVLLKGGHGAGEILTDLLLTRDDPTPRYFPHPRLPTPHTHGTGCALSSAIAAGLAREMPLSEAVEMAIAWLQQAITHAWPLGAGPGPIHHGWEYWKTDSDGADGE